MTRKKNNTSSYRVFMSFVCFENERIDVRGVFSKKCLDKWLSTRRKKIKYPQDSFQRVLYAHIRGVDERKPFPAKVEAELLRLLREDNPWRELLFLLKKNTSRRKFSRLGYHELLKRAKRSSRNHNTSLKTKCIAPKSLAHNEKENYYNRFFRILKSFHSSCLSKKILHTAKLHGYNLHSPALKYMMSLKASPQDPRFDSSFLLAESFKFCKSEPVGEILISSSWLIIHTNLFAQSLVGDDAVGRHYLDFCNGLAGELYAYTLRTPILFTKGEVSIRTFITRFDGQNEIVHGRYCLVGEVSTSYKISFQFQLATHLHPSIKNRVNLCLLK